jgi:DNA-binding CsgD family transcriptional regulator
VRSPDLSPLELEIVMHLANGKKIGEIAMLTDRSRSFIAKQANRARHKTGAKTLAHLVSIVIASGSLEWVDPEVGRIINGVEPKTPVSSTAPY